MRTFETDGPEETRLAREMEILDADLAKRNDPTERRNAKPAHIVADSGKREGFATGMVRDTREGKGRFELITPIALRRLALVYEKGAAKYAARNWERALRSRGSRTQRRGT